MCGDETPAAQKQIMPSHGMHSPFSSASGLMQLDAGRGVAAKEDDAAVLVHRRHSDSASSLRGRVSPGTVSTGMAGQDGSRSAGGLWKEGSAAIAAAGEQPGSSGEKGGHHDTAPAERHVVVVALPGNAAGTTEAVAGAVAPDAGDDGEGVMTSSSSEASINSDDCISTADIECGRLDSMRSMLPDLDAVPETAAAPPAQAQPHSTQHSLRQPSPSPSVQLQPQLSSAHSLRPAVLVRLPPCSGRRHACSSQAAAAAVAVCMRFACM